MSRHLLRTRGVGWLAVVTLASATLAVATLALPLSSPLRAAPPGDKDVSAAQKVRAALQAELAGQTAQRAELLESARREAPSYPPAQWHAGYIRSGKQWVSVEEAQRQGMTDKRLDDYGLQRGIAGETAGEQLALSMWCRAKGLAEQERLHLMKTLQLDPKNAEAAKRLGVRWVNGQWLTADEVAAQQEAERTAARNANKWAPLVRGWRDAIESKDAGRRAKALSELRAVSDVAALPTLEKLLVPRNQELAIEVVEIAGRMPEQPATDFLLRQAVLSSSSPVAEAAIGLLKAGDPYRYLPQLLSGLALPIEYSSVVTPNGAAVSFFQETQDAKHYAAYGQGISRSLSLTVLLRPAVDPRIRTIHNASGLEVGATKAELAQLNQEAANLRTQVDNANRQITGRNSRIGLVLSKSTGEPYTADPRHWWAWWTQRNETYAPEKPTYSHHYWEMVNCQANYVYAPMSCFPAGTPVWTERGSAPVERVRPGDRVLSQDQDTGELKFQSVIQTTLRPESPFIKIYCHSETISATRGHPFWVAGQGWRMAKNVKVGDLLHGVGGSVRVEAVEEEKEQRAYNLVVDGFNTYFVGQTGLLVHDNVLRKPTACVLPGLKKSELAD